MGTGSAKPSRNRNVSSFLLRLRTGAVVMFDSGEGTVGQLFQCAGRHGADQVIRDLACVCITHLHADHHLGLVRLLLRRRQLLGTDAPAPLIVAPTPVIKWLQRYSRLQDLGLRVANCLDLQTGTGGVPSELAALGCTLLQCVKVDHCYMAFGFVFAHQDGWKLVYSGDTRPCPALVRAGLDGEAAVGHRSCLPAVVDVAPTRVWRRAEDLKFSSPVRRGAEPPSAGLARTPRG